MRSTNPWYQRWAYSTRRGKEQIRERSSRAARVPLWRVVTKGPVEVYECGHRAPMKKDPSGQPYAATSRRCHECARVDRAFDELLAELGLQ